MTDLNALAARCLHATHADEIGFPQVIHTLTTAGFTGYQVDFRRRAVCYYHGDGAAYDFALPGPDLAASENAGTEHGAFDAAGVQDAVAWAQGGAADYRYNGFCAAIWRCGCAGYLVSLTGCRVVYYGHSGETHVEQFG